MSQIFIDCEHCGFPNAIGGDPALLVFYQGSEDAAKCEKCGKQMNKQGAYVGRWSDDGTEAIRLG